MQAGHGTILARVGLGRVIASCTVISNTLMYLSGQLTQFKRGVPGLVAVVCGVLTSTMCFTLFPVVRFVDDPFMRQSLRDQPDREVVLPSIDSAVAPQKRTKFKASCRTLHESSTAAVPELIPTMQRVILALAMGAMGASAFENSYLSRCPAASGQHGDDGQRARG